MPLELIACLGIVPPPPGSIYLSQLSRVSGCSYKRMDNEGHVTSRVKVAIDIVTRCPA